MHSKNATPFFLKKKNYKWELRPTLFRTTKHTGMLTSHRVFDQTHYHNVTTQAKLTLVAQWALIALGNQSSPDPLRSEMAQVH